VHGDANTLSNSPDDAHTMMPPPGVRLSTHTLPGRNTLEDTLASMRGFLEPRIEATSPGRLNPY